MPIKPVPKLPVLQNGVGAFVLACKRITVQFDQAGGSSQGLRDFLRLRLDSYAQKHPKIEFKVVQKAGHPVLRGEYSNGRDKAICVRNLNVDNVQNKLNVLRGASGERIRKRNAKVESINDSVRGVWSPLHVDPAARHKV